MIKASSLIRSIITISSAILLFGSCNKYDISEKQSESFYKLFGSYQEDLGTDVQLDDDGGYVILGTWTIADGSKDLCLIKTDKYGNEVEWSPKYFGTAGLDDIAHSLKILPDGYVMVGTATDANDTSSIMMVKTNKQGIAQAGFPKIIDIGAEAKGNDEAFDVEISDEFGFAIVGSSDGPPGGTKGGTDFILVFVDENGERLLLTRTWGYEDNDVINRIMKVNDGYILLGSTYFPKGVTHSDIAVFHVNYDGLGATFINLGTANNDIGEYMVPESDDAIIIVGTSTTAGAQSSIYLSRFIISSQTNTQINVAVPAGARYTGKSVGITAEGNYVLVGTETRTDNNIYILGTGTDGSQMFYTTFGETGDQSGSSFQITPDGGFIVLGNNAFEGNSMITLIKTDLEGSME